MKTHMQRGPMCVDLYAQTSCGCGKSASSNAITAPLHVGKMVRKPKGVSRGCTVDLPAARPPSMCGFLEPDGQSCTSVLEYPQRAIRKSLLHSEV